MTLVPTRMQQVKLFLNFYRKAQTLYDVHSPRIADYLLSVVEDQRTFYAFPSIELYRKRILEDHTELPIIDLGAGSKVNTNPIRTVSDIARSTPVPPRVGRRLFKTVHFFKPQTMIELGTSLGISTMYQSAARPSSALYSLEGNPAVAEYTKRQCQQMGLPSIKVVTGHFDDTLPQLLEKLNRVDYAFIDGNHQYEPTLQYTQWLLSRTHSESIILIADIYWSDDMKRAWEALKDWPEVRASIDLYDFGILLFSPSFRQKQHWTLAPRSWKPWHLGVMPPDMQQEQ